MGTSETVVAIGRRFFFLFNFFSGGKVLRGVSFWVSTSLPGDEDLFPSSDVSSSSWRLEGEGTEIGGSWEVTVTGLGGGGGGGGGLAEGEGLGGVRQSPSAVHIPPSCLLPTDFWP